MTYSNKPLTSEDGLALVDKADDLTPEWLSAVLSRRGASRAGPVTSVRWEPVGNGMTGTTVRLHLGYGGGEVPDAPEVLIAKMTSINKASSETGAALGIYRKEIRFYQEIAPSVAEAVPHALYADVDAKGERFLLLMEDLFPARLGDQIAGCSVEDAAAALDAIAIVHAPFWGFSKSPKPTWIDRERDVSLFGSGYQVGVEEVIGRYAHAIPEPLRDIALRFGDRVMEYYAQQPYPWTITHQDFRLDNLLFDARGGRMPVAVLDWQSVRVGPGVSDVSYFIGAGLSPELRRAHERSLLEGYRIALHRLGVEDLSADDAWSQYRLFAAEGLITAVVAASMLTPTERGDRMFVAMIERHTEHMRDLDTLSMIG